MEKCKELNSLELTPSLFTGPYYVFIFVPLQVLAIWFQMHPQICLIKHFFSLFLSINLFILIGG